MFARKIFLVLLLPMALTAPFAISVGHARPVLDEAGARVMTISTHGASVHQRLTLSLDKAAVVQLDADARDVLVSNPDMVDAVVRTPRRIFLLATKVGQTNAFFFDAAGNLYFADYGNNRVRKIAPNGIITTFAGSGNAGFGGDGGQASQASLNRPTNVFFDAAGKQILALDIRV